MSITYTQTVPSLPGLMNINSANMFLKTQGTFVQFADKFSDTLYMTFGPSQTDSNVLASNSRVQAPDLQSTSLNVSNGIVTTDATGKLTQRAGLTYDGSLLRIEHDARVVGNLTVQGTLTVLNTQTVLIEDPIVQVGVSNIFDDQDVGFILSANASVFNGSNVALGIIPEQREFVIALTQNSAESTSLNPQTSESINVHVYGNVIASGAFYGDGSHLTGVLSSDTLQDVTTRGATTTDTITVGGLTTSGTINGVSLSDGGVAGLFVGPVRNTGATANVLGYNQATGEIYDTGYSANGGSGSQDLDSVLTNGNVSSQTMHLTSSNIAIDAPNGTINAYSIVGHTLTGVYSAAVNTLNANEIHATDVYVSGNTTFNGPIVSNVEVQGALKLSGIPRRIPASNVLGFDPVTKEVFDTAIATGTLDQVLANGNTASQAIRFTGATAFTTTGSASIKGTGLSTDGSGNFHVTATGEKLVVDGTSAAVRFNSSATQIGLDADSGSVQVTASSNINLYSGGASEPVVSVGSDGNTSMTGDLNVSGNIIGHTLTGVYSGAINTLNTNQINNTNLYNSGTARFRANVNVDGSVIAGDVSTDTLEANVATVKATLTESLDVSGQATFNGVTTVSVLKFTPGGIDPSISSPAATYTGFAAGKLNVSAIGVTYGSATISSVSGTVTGLNITGLSDNAHLYLYVNGSQSFAAPTDGYTYLSTVTGTTKAMYHVFNVGGTIFVDMTRVN